MFLSPLLFSPRIFIEFFVHVFFLKIIHILPKLFSHQTHCYEFCHGKRNDYLMPLLQNLVHEYGRHENFCIIGCGEVYLLFMNAMTTKVFTHDCGYQNLVCLEFLALQIFWFLITATCVILNISIPNNFFHDCYYSKLSRS
jgi:hypothetical protein